MRSAFMASNAFDQLESPTEESAPRRGIVRGMAAAAGAALLAVPAAVMAQDASPEKQKIGPTGPTGPTGPEGPPNTEPFDNATYDTFGGSQNVPGFGST
jgi:hypothetical protein